MIYETEFSCQDKDANRLNIPAMERHEKWHSHNEGCFPQIKVFRWRSDYFAKASDLVSEEATLGHYLGSKEDTSRGLCLLNYETESWMIAPPVGAWVCTGEKMVGRVAGQLDPASGMMLVLVYSLRFERSPLDGWSFKTILDKKLKQLHVNALTLPSSANIAEHKRILKGIRCYSRRERATGNLKNVGVAAKFMNVENVLGVIAGVKLCVFKNGDSYLSGEISEVVASDPIPFIRMMSGVSVPCDRVYL